MKLLPTISTAFLAAGLLFSLNAQSVTTDPVGYVTADIAVGLNAVGISLINPSLLTTTVTSVVGNRLELLSTVNTSELLDVNLPFYVEFTSGQLVGERFDLDVSATVQENGNFLIVDISSSNNTAVFSEISSELSGATFNLIQHLTVAQVQSFASDDLTGNNNPALADQLSFFDNAINGYVSVFLRGDGVTWRRFGTTIVANNDPIAPGRGFFFNKRDNPITLICTGSVRMNSFALNLDSGLQLASTPFPIPLSPAQLGATAANGWVGSNNPSLADNIAIFDQAINGYITFFLRGDGVTWRRLGTTIEVTEEAFMLPNGSFFIFRGEPDNYLFVNPFANNL